MNLNFLIQEKIKNSRLYGVTKPKVIKEMYNIPTELNIKKIDMLIDSYYDTFYIKKHGLKINKVKKKDKIVL